MFENLEIRKVANGYILCITDESGDTREYVYDTSRKLMRVLRQHLDAKGLED
jgi:hypothetical protein